MCVLPPLCPVSVEVYDTIKHAFARDRLAEYLLGLTLLTGDGLPTDRKAGVARIALAAEAGLPEVRTLAIAVPSTPPHPCAPMVER